MQLEIVLFYGSVRTEREGIKAARFMNTILTERGHTVHFIDPKEYDFGLLDYMYKEFGPGAAPGKMEELAEMIRGADAFVVVSGEYNHSIPPGLTNLMDHFLEEYGFRPSGIVSYSAGSFGGVRAAMQLRAFLTELGTVAIPTIYPIPKVQDVFDAEGVPLDDRPVRHVQQFVNELEWYAKALRKGREEYPLPY